MLKKIWICFLLIFFITSNAMATKVPGSQMHLVSPEELARMASLAKDKLQRQAAENNRPVKLYLHWSAGHYDDFFDSYHISIDAKGRIYTSTKDLSMLKHHTYMRNKGAVGISLNACFNGTPKNLGNEPPTHAQIESMAKTIAILSQAFSIPIDKNHVMTHGEAADNIDKYFPPYEDNGRPYGMYGPRHNSQRWDLAILKNGDVWGSGGNTLRLEAILALFHLRKHAQEIKLD